MMRVLRGVVVAGLVLAPCRLAGADATSRFAELVQSAKTYQSLRTGGHWETLCDDRLEKGDDPQWHSTYPADLSASMGARAPGDPSEQGSMPSIVEVDGAPALVLDASGGAAQIAVGPASRCGMAIEMTARALDGSGADLSLVLDGIDRGPGLRVGCQHGTVNEFWVPRPRDPASPEMPAFPFAVKASEPVQAGGAWEDIRLEISADTLRGFVDGQCLGCVRLPPCPEFDEAMHQAEIFTCHGRMAIRRVEVQHFAILKHPVAADEAWRQAFGGMSRQQFEGQVDGMIALLAADDPKVRVRGEQMLMEAGDLAEPMLKIAAAGDLTEAGRRAAWIVANLNPKMPPIPALPSGLDQFRQNAFMFGPNAQLEERAMFMQWVYSDD